MLIHLETGKWYAGFTVQKGISVAFWLACKLSYLWNCCLLPLPSQLCFSSYFSPRVFTGKSRKENERMKEKKDRKLKWGDGGGAGGGEWKGFSCCSFTNIQLSKEKNPHWTLWRLHMPIYKCWQDSCTHFICTLMKKKLTWQISCKNKTIQSSFLKEVNKPGDGTQMYWVVPEK